MTAGLLPTLAWLDDAIHGRIKARRPMSLRADELAAYNEAVICGWVTAGSARREHLEHAYWAYCEIQRQPFVCVRTRRVYASVSFDFIASDSQLTALGRDDIGRVIEMVADARPGARVVYGTVSGYLSDVRVEDAKTVAAMIWASITAPGNWEQAR